VHYFDDAASGASDIGGRFGTTPGAWDQPRPFFLYAVNRDDTEGGLAFALSPDPRLRYSPAAEHIAWHGHFADSPSDHDLFFLRDGDSAGWAGRPAQRVGGVTMTKNDNEDWAVVGGRGQYGVGMFHVGRTFRFPPGQMGAEAGAYFSFTGGTTPTVLPTYDPEQTTYTYRLGLDGYVDIEARFVTDGGGPGRPGSGDGVLWVHVPFQAASDDTAARLARGVGFVRNFNAEHPLQRFHFTGLFSGASRIEVVYSNESSPSGFSNLKAEQQDGSSRHFDFTLRYRAF
jgi:hypothetical protein